MVVRYDDEENTNKFIEMNRSPRMQDVMEEWMNMYHSTVVEVIFTIYIWIFITPLL